MQSVPTLIMSQDTLDSLLPAFHPVKNRFVVKLHPSLTDREYAYIVDNTRSLIQDDENASFLERRSLLRSIDDARMALDIYFYVVSVLCCILLFFATWISVQLSCSLAVHVDRQLERLPTKSVFFNHWEERRDSSTQ